MVTPCSVELHRLWSNYATAGGSSATFLLQHFASLGVQTLLQVPRPPPELSTAVLRYAEANCTALSEEETYSEDAVWSEVMHSVVDDQRSHQPTDDAAAPYRQPYCHPRRPADGGSCGVERRLNFDGEAFSDDEAEVETSRDDASVASSNVLPPSWRQKELCEEELEKRLADLLEQETLSQGDFEEYNDANSYGCHSTASDHFADADRGIPSSEDWHDSANLADNNAAFAGCVPQCRWVFQTPVQRRRKIGKIALADSLRVKEIPAKSTGNAQGIYSVAGNEELDVEIAMTDATWGLLSVYHHQSERCRPEADSVISKLGPQERVLTIDWILQTCKAMNFPEAVAFTAILLFDRYCALLHELLPTEQMQVLYLSIISISLKMHGTAGLIPAPLRDVLSHLGQYRIPPELVFQQERQVLTSLGFTLCCPSPLEFLDLFAALMPAAGHNQVEDECCPACSDSLVWQLASFLLHLAIRETTLLLQYPHAILAASAMYTAMWSKKDRRPPCVTQQGRLVHLVWACVSQQRCSNLFLDHVPPVNLSVLGVGGHHHYCI